MSTFVRLMKYFLKFKWRILLGLISVGMMSASDTASAFLVARLFGVLQEIGALVQKNMEIVVDVPIELFGKTFTTFHVRGYDESFRLVVIASLTFFVLIFVKVCFVYVRELVMSSIQQKILQRFRLDMFNTLVEQPIQFFDKNKTGQIMSRITNDVNQLEQSLYIMVEIAQNIVYTLVFATALLFTNWQLTVFTIVIFSSSGLILRRFGDRIRSYSRSVTDAVADISAFLQEKLAAMRIVKSFTREEHEKTAFKKRVDTNYQYSIKIVRVVALLSPTNELFNTMVTTLIIIFVSYLFIQGSMTIETMMRFLLLMTFLAKPVKALGESIARIQRSLVSANVIFELLDMRGEKLTHSTEQPVTRGEVEFRDVSFSYNEDTEALQNVSFAVKSGEKVALVGPSGSGKTTLINLIPRFYEISNGSVLIDGRDSRTMNLVSLRSQIAIVPQEVTLFTGSIYENILYGRLDASKEEVIEAAKSANAHSFIIQCEKKYETEVGERGVQLSGGQRQRIAIARAILRNPRILLLDEATSALDTESERMVQEALDHLMRGRTSFVIAHRLSTILGCDQIFVLERGRIVERGTHEELLRNESGLYKRLYTMQFADEGQKPKD